MKVTTELLGLIFSFGFFLKTQAQAEIIVDKHITFYDGKGGSFESVDAQTVLTPSGNIVKNATFILPEGHFLIPDNGKEYLPVRILATDIFGNQTYLINYNVKVGKSGKFKVVLHLNGAGSEFPNGW